MIEVLDKKLAPASMSEEDWQKKKTQMLGSAHYMGGISSSLSGQYARGDQMLRAAMPFVAGDATQEAAVFYFLGLSNYKLADRDPTRAQEAVKFWRRCASRSRVIFRCRRRRTLMRLGVSLICLEAGRPLR